MIARSSGPSFLSRHRRELSVAAVLGLVLIALAVWAPRFYEPQPLLTRLTAAAPKLLLVCGMTVLLLVRQIDISIGSLFAVCGSCAGLAAAHLPWPLALVLAVGVGVLVGAGQGLLVAWCGLPGIVVTLAGMVTLREALRLGQQGVFINLPVGLPWFGLPMQAGQWTLCGAAFVFFLLLAFALRHLAAGRHIHAVGSDAEAARLAGLRPRGVTFAAFTFMGLCTGLAAVCNLVQSPQVDPNGGRGLELEIIAAAVVGGVAVSGGRGNLWGAFAGLLLLVCIGPALTYVGVKAHWEKALQGLIILAAVAIDGLRRRPARAT